MFPAFATRLTHQLFGNLLPRRELRWRGLGSLPARALTLIAPALLGAGACQQSQGTPARQAGVVTDSILLGAAANSENWVTFGGNYSNTRYSRLAQINPTNVHRLRVAWKHRFDVAYRERLLGYADEQVVWYRPETWAIHPREWGYEKQVSTPLAVNGVIYYTGPFNVVAAVDAVTGTELWHYQHKMRTTPMLCCGPSNRGAAVGGDKVFIATLDAHLIALDKTTGKLTWDVPLGDPRKGYSTTMAPLFVDGKVIVGVSGGDYGIRGFVDAYDAQTGKRVWRFWTVPSPEEGGWWGAWSATTPNGDVLPRDLVRERADSAKYPDSWQHGGGSVWMTPAYDPARRTLYVGTGNPAPAMDDAMRPGDNLYTSSILALDVETGRLRWYYQISPHDMWDRDAANPIVLFDHRAGDSITPALAQANKTGWVYVLDRRTGAQILRSEPFVPQKDMFARPGSEARAMYPTVFGATHGATPAYSPETGLLYVLGQHLPLLVRLKRVQYEPGTSFFGGEGVPLRAGDRTVRWGTLTAIDVSTGKIRWQRKSPEPLSRSGALATAGGLVFYGRADSLFAADASTGRTVWQFSAGSAVDGPPITFALDGRQYITVASRSGLLTLALP